MKALILFLLTSLLLAGASIVGLRNVSRRFVPLMPPYLFELGLEPAEITYGSVGWGLAGVRWEDVHAAVLPRGSGTRYRVDGGSIALSVADFSFRRYLLAGESFELVPFEEGSPALYVDSFRLEGGSAHALGWKSLLRWLPELGSLASSGRAGSVLHMQGEIRAEGLTPIRVKTVPAEQGVRLAAAPEDAASVLRSIGISVDSERLRALADAPLQLLELSRDASRRAER